MDADNDLEEYALMNMLEMEAVARRNDVEILVQFARPPTGTNLRMTLITSDAAVNGAWGGTHSDARRYLVTKNPSSNPHRHVVHRVGDLGPTDMGDPQTLNDFITWGQNYAPAEHYMVDLWDDGSGWDPYFDARAYLSRPPITRHLLR